MAPRVTSKFHTRAKVVYFCGKVGQEDSDYTSDFDGLIGESQMSKALSGYTIKGT
jgi:hypothetical protein